MKNFKKSMAARIEKKLCNLKLGLTSLHISRTNSILQHLTTDHCPIKQKLRSTSLHIIAPIAVHCTFFHCIVQHFTSLHITALQNKLHFTACHDTNCNSLHCTSCGTMLHFTAQCGNAFALH